MKFFCIIENDNENSQKRYSLLEDSSKKRGIEFVKIIPDEFDYAKNNIENGSLLYTATAGNKGRIIEKWIGGKQTTFYKSNSYMYSNRSSSFFNNRDYNLPIIKTIPDFLSNFDSLDSYVNFVDGFPLIVKITGGSHGIGVVKIDSIESLKSFSDYLKTNSINAILRKFIKHKKQGRLIVLGDKVIASHLNHCKIDFRSNVGSDKERSRESMIFSDHVQDIAVKAVNSLGFEFGGVDILFEEETNEPYIAEVNFPCFFPTTQYLTGIDISGQMIDFLVNKNQKSRM